MLLLFVCPSVCLSAIPPSPGAVRSEPAATCSGPNSNLRPLIMGQAPASRVLTSAPIRRRRIWSAFATLSTWAHQKELMAGGQLIYFCPPPPTIRHPDQGDTLPALIRPRQLAPARSAFQTPNCFDMHLICHHKSRPPVRSVCFVRPAESESKPRPGQGSEPKTNTGADLSPASHLHCSSTCQLVNPSPEARDAVKSISRLGLWSELQFRADPLDFGARKAQL